MAKPESGTFEVTGHYEMASRGAFVLGRIRSGAVAPGMLVKTNSEPAVLRIFGVECLDSLAEKKHWNALEFTEQPTIDFVERVFPVGHVIEVSPPDELDS